MIRNEILNEMTVEELDKYHKKIADLENAREMIYDLIPFRGADIGGSDPFTEVNERQADVRFYEEEMANKYAYILSNSCIKPEEETVDAYILLPTVEKCHLNKQVNYIKLNDGTVLYLTNVELKALPGERTANDYYRMTNYICSWTDRAKGWNEYRSELKGEK